MLPDLESLRCFVAACTQPTFRAAARSVALSPAAFSTRIRLLEEQAGAPLFHRTTRRVNLARAGERLLPAARVALDAARRALEAAREEGRPAPFEITLGTRWELGMSWLVPALAGLSRALPERTVSLFFGDVDLVPRVRAGTLDAAVTSARLAFADVRYAALHEERYVLVGARSLRRGLARPEDTAHHTLLDVHPDLPLFRYFLDAAPASAVWAFSRVEHLGAIAAIRHRVLEGAGVAVLPHYFVRDDIARRRLRVLLPRVKLASDYFRLVWRAGNPREPELSAIAAELRRLPLR